MDAARHWWDEVVATHPSEIVVIQSRLHHVDLVGPLSSEHLTPSLESQKEPNVKIKKEGLQFLVVDDADMVLGRHVSEPEAVSHMEELKNAGEPKDVDRPKAKATVVAADQVPDSHPEEPVDAPPAEDLEKSSSKGGKRGK